FSKYYLLRRLFSSLLYTYTYTSSISTLSLHDALPIFTGDCHVLFGKRAFQSARGFLDGGSVPMSAGGRPRDLRQTLEQSRRPKTDRKSTRLNSSHSQISYAVFCLKKKKKINNHANKNK